MPKQKSVAAVIPLHANRLLQIDKLVRERVPLDALRPTQGAVGYRAVRAKRKRLACHLESPRKIARYLDKRPIPAVLGPRGEFYIIDRHHLSSALRSTGVREVSIAVLADLSALQRASFWACMERSGMLHPYDASGFRIHPSRLPKSIGDLADDPYRDLAWSVRRQGGFDKSGVPFSEFRWANFFRTQIPADLIARDYQRAVRRALRLTNARSARTLPGYAA